MSDGSPIRIELIHHGSGISLRVFGKMLRKQNTKSARSYLAVHQRQNQVSPHDYFVHFES
jgi:hypothetical protein